MKTLSTVFCIGLLAGCTVPPEKPYPVSPHLKVNAGAVGKDSEVSVAVSDLRASISQSSIPIEGDLAAVLRESISQSLQSEGFTVLPNRPERGAELRVQILSLSRQVHVGLLIPYHQLYTTLLVNALCEAPNRTPVEKQYSKVHWTECCFHTDTHEEIEEQVDRTVSDTLNKLLNDDNIMQCLVKQN
jgi:uncharacterized lipoprotein YajG